MSTPNLRRLWIIVLLFSSQLVSAQQPDKIREALTTQDCVNVPVQVCRYDYVVDGYSIEALSFKPVGNGRFPGVLMIPGYQRTALDLISLGVSLAREGFAGVAVSQPSFGKSQGKADYVGPFTIKVLTAGYQKLRRESYVDSDRMGIYGYSRGGMAASLLAVKLKDVRAVVLGAGIYDFQKAHDEVKIEGIRKNMETETGMTEAAVRERSSIFQMENLKCPVLILHGEKDENVPVSQAYLLRDRLTQLKKDFEIKLYPNKAHSIGGDEVQTATIDFFKRRLASKTG
jgi:dipeptidyl aminopeptidase/acylaminoacyl peptidase